MSSAIHYKVKPPPNAPASAPTQSGTINFDGTYLSVLELKRKILYDLAWLRSEADCTFDLHLTNSQNAEEYREEGYSVHRNMSVIVKKIQALPAQARKLFIAPGSLGPEWNKSTSTWTPNDRDGNSNLLPLGRQASNGDEDDLSSAMRAASAYAGDPRKKTTLFQGGHTNRALTAASAPPRGYVCHRCKQGGHYIQFCPTNGDSNYDQARRAATTREDREREREEARDKEKARYTRDSHASSSSGGGAFGDKKEDLVWLKPIEDPKGLDENAASKNAANFNRLGPSKYVASSGFFTSTTTGIGQAPQVNVVDSAETYVPPPSGLTYQYSDPSTAVSAREPSVTLRPDLTCQLCKDYFVDAQVIGCCYTSSCNECIRKHFDSTPACPSCMSTDVTVADLNPNVNLQKAVETFLRDNPSVVRGDIKRAREAKLVAEAALAKIKTPTAAAPSPAAAAAYAYPAPPPAQAAYPPQLSADAYPPPPAANGYPPPPAANGYAASAASNPYPAYPAPAAAAQQQYAGYYPPQAAAASGYAEHYAPPQTYQPAPYYPQHAYAQHPSAYPPQDYQQYAAQQYAQQPHYGVPQQQPPQQQPAPNEPHKRSADEADHNSKRARQY